MRQLTRLVRYAFPFLWQILPGFADGGRRVPRGVSKFLLKPILTGS
jgi:hypothetical protein